MSDPKCETTDAYMQMIYIDTAGSARPTGIGAAMKTGTETRQAFEALRHRSVDFDDASL
jgi:hypothetical protein